MPKYPEGSAITQARTKMFTRPEKDRPGMVNYSQDSSPPPCQIAVCAALPSHRETPALGKKMISLFIRYMWLLPDSSISCYQITKCVSVAENSQRRWENNSVFGYEVRGRAVFRGSAGEESHG